MVDGHWPAVEVIAAALLKRKTLSGDEVRALVLAESSGRCRGPIVESERAGRRLYLRDPNGHHVLIGLVCPGLGR